MLGRLDQKVWGQEPVFRPYRSQMVYPRRRDETLPTRVDRRNVVSPSCSPTGKRAARLADGTAGTRRWRKRRLLCNAADRDTMVLRESGLTSIGCLVTRTSDQPTKEAKQMTAVVTYAGAASRCKAPRHQSSIVQVMPTRDRVLSRAFSRRLSGVR